MFTSLERWAAGARQLPAQATSCPAVRKALVVAAKPGLRFHGRRHTYASLLIAAGAHPHSIKKHLGHSDIRTTFNVYGRQLCGLRRKRVDLLRGTLRVEEALEGRGRQSRVRRAEVGGEPRSASRSRSSRCSPSICCGTPAGSGPAALVFTTPSGRPIRHGLFYKRVFKPAVRAVLPESKHGLRFHGLRHTCASLSLGVAPNLHMVKERLGHEDIRTTINVYGHLVASVDAALADGLDALFTEATSPSDADTVAELRP